MSNSEHTPVPWGIEATDTTLWVGPMRPDGKKIEDLVFYIRVDPEYTDAALAKRKANAAFVIKAVNSHNALVSALEQIIEMNVQYAIDRYGDASQAEMMACVSTARAALAEAKGA